jgi:hypothetical protein
MAQGSPEIGSTVATAVAASVSVVSEAGDGHFPTALAAQARQEVAFATTCRFRFVNPATDPLHRLSGRCIKSRTRISIQVSRSNGASSILFSLRPLRNPYATVWISFVQIFFD